MGSLSSRGEYKSDNPRGSDARLGVVRWPGRRARLVVGLGSPAVLRVSSLSWLLKVLELRDASLASPGASLARRYLDGEKSLRYTFRKLRSALSKTGLID